MNVPAMQFVPLQIFAVVYLVGHLQVAPQDVVFHFEFFEEASLTPLNFR